MIKTKNHYKYYRLSLRDMEGAAEAAIERRNESEISTVLARCSTTSDHLLMERLNRAKATVAKKWACTFLPRLVRMHLLPNNEPLCTILLHNAARSRICFWLCKRPLWCNGTFSWKFCTLKELSWVEKKPDSNKMWHVSFLCFSCLCQTTRSGFHLTHCSKPVKTYVPGIALWNIVCLL